MNTFKKLLCGLAVMGMFTACSSDEPKGGPAIDAAKGDFFTTLTLSVPVSRAETIDHTGNTNSSDGYEVGQDSENTVGSVIIVLATNNGLTTPSSYTYITSNQATPVNAGTVNGQIAYQVTFQSETLVANAGKQICVFAICNPTEELVADPSLIFKGDGTDLLGTGNDNLAAITTPNKFLMTNFSLTKVILPSAEDLRTTYNKESNPFNLGIVQVERVVARFDYKQKEAGAVEVEEGVSVNLAANQYPIMVGATPYVPEVEPSKEPMKDPETGEQMVNPATGELMWIHYPGIPAQEAVPAHVAGYVEIDGMAAFNIAKEYYYLPRVATVDANAISDVITCGLETPLPSCWVVSPYYQNKLAATLDLGWIRTAYNDNMLGEESVSFIPGNLTFTTMDKLVTDDNDENWGPNNQGIKDYKIWRYVTENTIPGVESQRHGITTGVCFRAKLAPVKNAGIEDALTTVIEAGEKPIYVFGNEIVGDLDLLKAKVTEDPTTPLAVAFRVTAQANGYAETVTPDDVTEDFTMTTKGGLKILVPQDGKYYFYYYYYNRHWDNGEPTQMRNMEFATVRNNVYKLFVEEINQFGHTASPDNDPEPEKPEDPDEESKVYFRVQVRVLPWVVRINNIKF